MSIVEKRSPSHAVDYGGTDDGMPATTSICIALVVALILYVAGSAVFQRDVAAGAPRQATQAEMSFHGP
jgi:hypothetical protein